MLGTSSPPSAVSGALSMSSLPSLHTTFTSEHAVLEQLLYKNKNQHRKAKYYQRLMAVARSNRHIDLLTPYHTTQLSSLHSLHNTADSLRSSLAAILQAAEPLYALLRQTYFMPFALTSLAVLARLLVVIKAALLVVLAEAKQSEEREEGRVRLFAARSVGTALLRALREKRVEEVVSSTDGYELDETWSGGVASAAVAGELHSTAEAALLSAEEAAERLTVETRNTITTDDEMIDDDDDDGSDDEGSVLQRTATSAVAAAKATRQPVTIAPASASTQTSSFKQTSSIHPPLTRDIPPTPVAPPPPVSAKPPPASVSSRASAIQPTVTAPAAAAAAAGSRKRKVEAQVREKPAVTSQQSAQHAVRGVGQQSGKVQRTAVGFKGAGKSVALSKSKSNVALDDIDAIFGF